MHLLKEITKGIIRENPVLVLLIGLCPTLAVTSRITDAVGMSIAAAFVLICSNLIISMIKDVIPKKIRIPCYIVVIATFVTLVQMFMAAYFPDLNDSLGIFIPLIVVNCIILGRAEAFAGRNGILASAADGLGMSMGFAFALLVISFVREVLGSWSIGGIPVSDGGFAPMAVMIMAPGAFVVVALILGLMNALRDRKRTCAVAGALNREITLYAASKPEALKLARADNTDPG
ncbi:MAG: electron transport complex subunit E [Planctomycetes bacterium]|nr:electron transport complex subunit E [Planctomycetota bacterium]